MRVIFLFRSFKHTKLLICKAILQIHLDSKACVTLFSYKNLQGQSDLPPIPVLVLASFLKIERVQRFHDLPLQ
jgi:hypothetical protein